MGLWSATKTDERYVEKWQACLDEGGWTLVEAALTESAECLGNQDYKKIVIGLAAADIVGVAVSFGKPGGWNDPEVPPKTREWIESHPCTITAGTIQKAIKAINRAEQYFGETWAFPEEDNYGMAAQELREALGDRSDDDDTDSPES